MKKSKEINNFHNDLLMQFESIELLINDYKKRIKKEYQQVLIDLKRKYLKSKEITLTDEINLPIPEENEELLDRIILEGNIYYFENKERGKVFDTSNNEVGVVKNGSIIFEK